MNAKAHEVDALKAAQRIPDHRDNATLVSRPAEEVPERRAKGSRHVDSAPHDHERSSLGVITPSPVAEIIRHLAEALEDHRVLKFADVRITAARESDRTRVTLVARHGFGWRRFPRDIRQPGREPDHRLRSA